MAAESKYSSDLRESIHRVQAREQVDASASARGPGGAGARQAPARLLTKEQIHDIFMFYCNFGRSSVMTVQDSLDSFMFMKFAKECPGLLGGGVTRTDIDLIFTKARPKFERRLSFEHFLDALSAISERKHPDFPPAEGLRLLIANHLVPHYDLVTHEMEKTGEDVVPLAGIYKRLYDVRNYTGVYAERFRSGDGRINGESDNRAGKRFTGMTNQRTDEIIHDISVLMRPDLKSGTMGRKGRSGSPSRSSTPGRRSRSKGRAGSRGRSTRRPASSGGATRGGVDKRAQDELMASIAAAQASGDTTALASTIMALAGKLQEEEGGSGGGGSAAEAAAEIDELYADIEHFTGQLETTTDPTAVRDLQLAIRDRSARISKLQASMGSRGGGAGGARGGGSGRRGAPTPAYATSTNSVGQLVLTDVESLPKLSQVQIQDIFHFYCNFGRSSVMTVQDSLDSFMFMKFAKECPGLMDRIVTRTEIDLIFTKARPKLERRLGFTHFLDALSAISERKYPDYTPADGLRLLIANHLVPHYDLVLHEMNKTGEDVVPLAGIYKRLYDVRNYTGVYAERFRSGDGRINGESDNRAGKRFNGRTNQGTDEIIHDISVLMRPNLTSGSMRRSRIVADGGSPRRGRNFGKTTSRSGSPARSMSAGRRGGSGGRAW